MSGNAPEKKFRAGAISATVWKNEGKNKLGQPTAYFTVSVERSYKDKNDQWQSTTTFRTSDLPRLSLVLNKAYEYLVLKDSSSEEQGPDNGPAFNPNSIPDEEIVM